MLVSGREAVASLQACDVQHLLAEFPVGRRLSKGEWGMEFD